MNIFAVDEDPTLAARALCDQHVIKMTLESAQMLCTITGQVAYRPTHEHHPCVLWLKESGANAAWLYQHALALATEYTHRFQRVHSSEGVIRSLQARWLSAFWEDHMPFVQCVPDDLVRLEGGEVDAYRDYYERKAFEFKRPMRYTGRYIPGWLSHVSDLIHVR
jgi:hypothetical protein